MVGLKEATRVADDLFTLTVPGHISAEVRAQIMSQWGEIAGEGRRLIVLEEGARLEQVRPPTVCRLHFIAYDQDNSFDQDRSFDRVPCHGEDVLVEGDPNVWRVVGVVWALDKPLIELSRVSR